MTRTVKYREYPTPPIESVSYAASTNSGATLTIKATPGPLFDSPALLEIGNKIAGIGSLGLRLNREDLRSLSEDIITILKQTEGES